MKSAACLFAFAALVAVPVFAQTSSSSAPSAPHFAPVPPPPGMNDPGVNPAAAPAAASSSSIPSGKTPAEITPTHLPSKAIPLPGGDSTPGTSTPAVTVRQEGDKTVQEYREAGRLYMVIVTPKGGLAQTYMIDSDGHMLDPHGAPPVKPVTYKVMEWGGSKPAQDSSTSDAASQ